MAVFTPVDDTEAAAFLADYDLGALLEFQGISEGVSNTNFRVVTEAGAYVLTLFEAVTPEADLPYFMDLTRYLAEAGYPAPAPIADRAGQVLRPLNGRTAALIAWLPGAWPRDPDLATVAACARALARMHRVCEGFSGRRANSMGPEAWARLAERSQTRAKGPLADLLADLDQERGYLQRVWSLDLPTGTLHGDYFPDNVLMTPDGSVGGVIDFYYACTDRLAYDLAIALNAWGFTPGGQPLPDVQQTFLSAYAAERPLTEAERSALPDLCRAAALRFTLSRLHDWLWHDPAWLVQPKDPEAFYRRLQYFRTEAAVARLLTAPQPLSLQA